MSFEGTPIVPQVKITVDDIPVTFEYSDMVSTSRNKYFVTVNFMPSNAFDTLRIECVKDSHGHEIVSDKWSLAFDTAVRAALFHTLQSACETV